jgi:magnesium-protoporphyrin IX monomethyl ester (oxidative) cyclase
MSTTLEQRAARLNETTKSAVENTVLSPRFYTTDFAYMDKLNVDLVRGEWDGLIAELKSDPNRNHFIRDHRFHDEITNMEPELKRECSMPRSRSGSPTPTCASCSA